MQKASDKQSRLEEACELIIKELVSDPNREGLIKTPNRYASFLIDLTRGYEINIDGKNSLFKTA